VLATRLRSESGGIGHRNESARIRRNLRR
jgi:hypothetical protein